MTVESLFADLVASMPEDSSGQQDCWALYRDGKRFRSLVDLLTAPLAGRRPSKIAGVEARGLLLGGAAALRLGVGFIPIRKAGGYLPGLKFSTVSARDWAGKVNEFELQVASLYADDRVALVDDWYTTGSQALAAKELIERAGAKFVGASVIVEEGRAAMENIPGLTALLRWTESEKRFSVSPFNGVLNGFGSLPENLI